ncbi:uncharacterized protein LOC117251341 isoform X1 [Epinephelus lanceolatus]
MDKLESAQHNLCMWLSSDPDYILEKCGDILSMNEFREVQRQSSALDKMKVLLKIIMQKGGDTPQYFLDILKQHQSHYQHVPQLFNPNTESSPTPTVFADGSSVVTARTMKNIKAKKINIRVETVSNAGSRPTATTVGQVPGADYTACDSSIICGDTMTDIEVDGELNLSASVTPSQVRAETVDETLPSSQGPAVKTITEHKLELIDCLRADHSFILQHVHAKQIVTDRQYQNLKHILQPEETVTNLIDKLIVNGQNSCSLFLEVLKEPDILKTYPQLREITKKMC